MNFRGNYPYQLDDRGRLPIPPRYRLPFEPGAVLVPGTEPCIEVYTQEGWDKEAEVLAQVPMESEEARQAVRAFFSTSIDAQVDGQGRIVLPASLREFGGLKREVVVIGAKNRLEIWDREAWDSQQPELQAVRRAVLSDIGKRKAQTAQAG